MCSSSLGTSACLPHVSPHSVVVTKTHVCGKQGTRAAAAQLHPSPSCLHPCRGSICQPVQEHFLELNIASSMFFGSSCWALYTCFSNLHTASSHWSPSLTAVLPLPYSPSVQRGSRSAPNAAAQALWSASAHAGVTTMPDAGPAGEQAGWSATPVEAGALRSLSRPPCQPRQGMTSLAAWSRIQMGAERPLHPQT